MRGAASAASPHSLRAGVWFGTAHGDVIATATNADRYRCGPHAMWGGGPGAYLWRGARGRLGLQANCSGEWRDVDVQGGATVADTGRLVVCLGPDLSLVWGNGLSAELGVDLPVFRRADGEQLLPTWRTHAGVAYAW